MRISMENEYDLKRMKKFVNAVAYSIGLTELADGMNDV